MVEGARLESVYTLTRIEGSNPSLSAIHKQAPFRGFFMYGGERGFGSGPMFDKFAGSEFARPQGARRVRRRDAPHNPCVNLDSRFHGNDV